MRVLLVDNGTIFLDGIAAMFPRDELTIVRWDALAGADPTAFDFLVLSGGGAEGLCAPFDAAASTPELALIAAWDKPLLGICMGFELIAHLYGGVLVERAEKIKGLADIDVVHDDPVFAGLRHFRAFESHHFVLPDAPAPLLALARSDSGVQMLRHTSKSIYATQFHPERFAEEAAGHEVVERAITLLRAGGF